MPENRGCTGFDRDMSVQTAVEWLRNNQLNLNGKTKLANLFGGNQRMAFAA